MTTTTARKIHVEIPNASSLKAEELATLRKLTDSLVGTESYLSALFTERLYRWFESQVQVDGWPNLMAEFESMQQQFEQVSRRATEAETRVRDLEKQVELTKNYGLEQLDIANKRTSEWVQSSARWHQLHDEKWDELVRKQSENAELETRNAELQDQIIRLKAKLFDLEHPEA